MFGKKVVICFVEIANFSGVHLPLNKSVRDGNMNGIVINHVLYADNIDINSISSSGIQ